MRVSTLLIATTFVVAMAGHAAAKPKGMGGLGGGGARSTDFSPGRDFSSSLERVRPWQNENHRAYWAPGHVKKRSGGTSARIYAPSRANRETYLPAGQRLR
jgi:hypothetical protein